MSGANRIIAKPIDWVEIDTGCWYDPAHGANIEHDYATDTYTAYWNDKIKECDLLNEAKEISQSWINEYFAKWGMVEE